MKAAGEIYFIGEKDLRSKEVTPYFKVGIVRENPENADRNSTQRLLEHQTGNPRELYIESVVKTDLVELVETLLHKQFASLGVRGEWMLLNTSELIEVQKAAETLAKEASEITADIEKAEKLAKVISDEELIPATDELKALNEIYLESNAKLKSCEQMQDTIKEILADALEDEDEEEEVGAFIYNSMNDLRARYENVLLFRNEMHLAIYNFSDGEAFYPDFLLLLQETVDGEVQSLQVFIEPKGDH